MVSLASLLTAVFAGSCAVSAASPVSLRLEYTYQESLPSGQCLRAQRPLNGEGWRNLSCTPSLYSVIYSE